MEDDVPWPDRKYVDFHQIRKILLIERCRRGQSKGKKKRNFGLNQVLLEILTQYSQSM